MHALSRADLGSARPGDAVSREAEAGRRPGPWGRTRQRLVTHLVHLSSNALGDDVVSRRLRIALMRRAGARVGRGVSLHGGGYLSVPGRLVVGDGTSVNRNCYFDLEAEVVLGDRVTVGHGATFVTTQHDLGPHDRRCGGWAGRPIVVGSGSWIGANATLLPGVVVGRGAVVAAGAVVLDDVADDVLVAGVPARPTRSLR